MIVCAAGDIHGALDRLYADVLDFEASLGVRVNPYCQVFLSPRPECDLCCGVVESRRRPPRRAKARENWGEDAKAPVVADRGSR